MPRRAWSLARWPASSCAPPPPGHVCATRLGRMEKRCFCSSGCSQSPRLRLSNAACSARRHVQRGAYRCASPTDAATQNRRLRRSGSTREAESQPHQRQGLETREEQEQMMKAFIVDRYGSKDGVRAGEMPDTALREDDVLVQIHAAGVKLLDAKIRDGDFK